MATIDKALPKIFGKNSNIFIHTKVRALLFDGIDFCSSTNTLSKMVCDIVKQKNVPTIRETADGTLKFSFFNHVNNFHQKIKIYKN